MGLDLALGISPYQRFAGTSPVHPVVYFPTETRVLCDRHYAFFAAIRALAPHPIPAHWRVIWATPTGEGSHTTDPATLQPLTMLSAGAFHALDPAPLVLTPWNQAIVVFLQAMPPDIPIVLWWH